MLGLFETHAMRHSARDLTVVLCGTALLVVSMNLSAEERVETKTERIPPTIRTTATSGSCFDLPKPTRRRAVGKGPPCSIRPTLRITVSEPAICANGMVRVSWQASESGANVCIDGVGSGLPATGFRDIQLASSAVFRGRAFYCNYGAEVRAEVAVLPQPSGRITVSTTSVEANTTFTASMPPGAASYAWNATNGTIVSGANSNVATIRSGASGVVTVNGMASNGEGCSASDTALVSITEPIPPPIVTGWPESAPPRQFGQGFPLRFTIEHGASWNIASSLANCLSIPSGTSDGTFETIYSVCIFDPGADTVTLTVTGQGGTTIKTLPVYVNCGHPGTLAAKDTSINQGATTTLTVGSYTSWTLASAKGNPLSKTSGCCEDTVTFTGAIRGIDTITLTWPACPGEPSMAMVQITVQ